MTHKQAQTVHRQVVVVPIDEFMEEGLLVFDSDGELLGRIDRYSQTAGYLKVKKDVLFPTNLYVPFHLIKTIDPREIFLKVPRETLLARYTLPPAITTAVARVEEPEAREPDGTPSVHVHEQRRVRSGYDQTEVILDTIDLTDIANRLAVGMAVYDADGKRVGEVTQYDSARAVMVVEKGLKPREFFIPFSVIAEVDTSDMFVSLLVPKAALERDYATLPSTDVSGTTRVMDPTIE